MKDKFIHVSEQPPPKDTNILAVDKFGGVANIYWNDKGNEWCFETFGGWYLPFKDQIIYWQEIEFPSIHISP